MQALGPRCTGLSVRNACGVITACTHKLLRTLSHVAACMRVHDTAWQQPCHTFLHTLLHSSYLISLLVLLVSLLPDHNLSAGVT